MGFLIKSKTEKIAQIQQEKIEQLEQRVKELEVQCFDSSLQTADENERKFIYALHKNFTLIKKVDLLSQNLGLEFFFQPKKVGIRKKPETCNVQPETLNPKP